MPVSFLSPAQRETRARTGHRYHAHAAGGGSANARLAQAFAEFGRIDKTIHTLTYLDDEAKRRATLIQSEPGRRSPCLGPRRLPRQTWRTAATLP